MIFLLILIIGTATGYDLKCPAKAEWRLKGNISCSSEDKYVCLFHLLEEKYMENCSGSDQSSIGSKLVFQPLFNLAVCDAGRYQPIVFTTHGNSDCIYSKSKCADEGQLVFSNDSSSTDTACRCDYTQGYAFVTRPKNRCFCNPSDADCSCYKSTCTKLSADYKCVTDREIMVNSTCQEILPNIPYNTDENTTKLTESNIKVYSSAHHVVYFIIASIVVYFVVAVVVLKVSDFVTGAISTQIDENETIDEVVIQPNETIDDIATHLHGNETADDERQKFIHELFLKGECGKLHFARLVFIGKHGVGKTSLMKRLLWHNKEDVTSTESTDGIEVEKCNINIADGKWSPCNEYVSFWFDAIHCYWSTTKEGRLDPPIIVVCTNEDKLKEPSEREKRQKQFKKNLRKVMNNQEKKGHLRNIHFISNTEDTDIVFEKIRKDISRQAMDMEDWGKDCPLKWLLFQQVILKLKDNNVPISSTNALLKIAKHKDIDISEDNEVKQCLKYCHDMGTVVYFDEENLADHVILDPKWLINALRCLVSDKIDNVIEVSDDWETLTETGQLTNALISLLFKKEPELKFEENKAHLIEVMKRFDIIVNLKNSTALYMPCMMKSCSFSEVQKQFGDENQPFYKTSWLCLEFKFLPPAFFNHIIAWYIKQYQVHVIIDKENRSKRNALYRQIGIFDLDLSCCEQLVVCEGPNVIALQVWDLRKSNKTYGDLESSLYKFVETLGKHYNLNISYTNAFTCTDGDFTINRKSIKDLTTVDYRCSEHKIIHLSDDLINPWTVSKQLLMNKRRKENEMHRELFEESLKEFEESGAVVW